MLSSSAARGGALGTFSPFRQVPCLAYHNSPSRIPPRCSSPGKGVPLRFPLGTTHYTAGGGVENGGVEICHCRSCVMPLQRKGRASLPVYYHFLCSYYFLHFHHRRNQLTNYLQQKCVIILRYVLNPGYITLLTVGSVSIRAATFAGSHPNGEVYTLTHKRC